VRRLAAQIFEKSYSYPQKLDNKGITALQEEICTGKCAFSRSGSCLNPEGLALVFAPRPALQCRPHRFSGRDSYHPVRAWILFQYAPRAGNYLQKPAGYSIRRETCPVEGVPYGAWTDSKPGKYSPLAPMEASRSWMDSGWKRLSSSVTPARKKERVTAALPWATSVIR
jgi:hypothetical protein